MDIIKLYKDILSVANLRVSEDGYVSRVILDESSPFMVEGKRLVLPTQQHLNNPDKTTRVIFHPLRENPLHGESEVLVSFRQALNTHLNISIGLLLTQMLQLATSDAEHSKLSPDQSAFLSRLKKADETTFINFTKLLQAMPIDQTKQAFVQVFLKKGGEHNGRKYKRIGVVHFPLYQELIKKVPKGAPRDKVYDVDLRAHDRDNYIALMEYVFNQIGTPGAYNAPSDSDIAPSTEAIMAALLKVGSELNDQIDLFSNIFEDIESMKINSDWVETFDNLSNYIVDIRKIPTQLGNEGSSLKGQGTGNKLDDVEMTRQQAPAAVNTENMSISERLRAQEQQRYQQAQALQQVGQGMMPGFQQGFQPSAVPAAAMPLPRTATGQINMAEALRQRGMTNQPAGMNSGWGGPPLNTRVAYSQAPQQQAPQTFGFGNVGSPFGYSSGI